MALAVSDVGWLELHWKETTCIELVAVNNPFISTDYMAYMLKYDIVHERMVKTDIYAEDEQTLRFDGKKVTVLGFKELSEIPWSDHCVHYVVECTGNYTMKDGVVEHLKGCAKKVIVTGLSGFSKDAPMFVMGVDEHEYRSEYNVVAMANCTTNCLIDTAGEGSSQQIWGCGRGDDNRALLNSNTKVSRWSTIEGLELGVAVLL